MSGSSSRPPGVSGEEVAPAAPAIQTWSTAEVPRAQRFDYFVEALSSALIPMRADSATRDGMQAHIEAAEFDGVTVIRQNGTAHWSYRDARELARDGEHSFHLIANYSAPWSMSHRGRIRLQPGDAVLTDSRIGHRLVMAEPYDVLHLKLSAGWMEQRLGSPNPLVGRRIPASDRWGSALTSFIAQLSPQYLITAPLPARVITDQLGALLTLVLAQCSGKAAPASAAAALRARVKDAIHQHCAEPALAAADVGASLGVTSDAIRDCLVEFGETFEDLLLRTRLGIAERMLKSKLFGALSVGEIAVRAGFSGETQLNAAFGFYSTSGIVPPENDSM